MARNRIRVLAWCALLFLPCSWAAPRPTTTTSNTFPGILKEWEEDGESSSDWEFVEDAAVLEEEELFWPVLNQHNHNHASEEESSAPATEEHDNPKNRSTPPVNKASAAPISAEENAPAGASLPEESSEETLGNAPEERHDNVQNANGGATAVPEETVSSASTEQTAADDPPVTSEDPPPLPPRNLSPRPKATTTTSQVEQVATPTTALPSNKPLETLEKLQYMLDETDFLSGVDDGSSSSGGGNHSPGVIYPSRRKQRNARAAAAAAAAKSSSKIKPATISPPPPWKPPPPPMASSLEAAMTSDIEDHSDGYDGLGYTLPNLPIYLSDAEDDTDITSSMMNAHSSTHSEEEAAAAARSGPAGYPPPHQPQQPPATQQQQQQPPPMMYPGYNPYAMPPPQWGSPYGYYPPPPQGQSQQPPPPQQQQQQQQQYYMPPPPPGYPGAYYYPRPYVPRVTDRPTGSTSAAAAASSRLYHPSPRGIPTNPGISTDASVTSPPDSSGTSPSLQTKMNHPSSTNHPPLPMAGMASATPPPPPPQIFPMMESALESSTAMISEEVSSTSDARRFYRLTFGSVLQLTTCALLATMMCYAAVSPRDLPYLDYNQAFYANLRTIALACLPPLLTSWLVVDVKTNQFPNLVRGFATAFTWGYVLTFGLELLAATWTRLAVFAMWEPRIFDMTPQVPLIVVPWVLREQRMLVKPITLIVQDIVTSAAVCPLLEEWMKLMIFQWVMPRGKNFRWVKKKTTSSRTKKAKRKCVAEALEGTDAPPGSPTTPFFQTPGNVINVNHYVSGMLAVSLGLKLADTIRRICMYTKASDANKGFYAFCRGIFPMQELCGTVTVLSLARRDVLGQKMPIWKLLLPSAIIHGMANFRGMKPIFKWNSATPWTEMQLSPNFYYEGATFAELATKAFPKIMWLIILFRVMGYCIKNYYMINRQAVKRTTTYAGKHAAFSAELAAAEMLKKNSKEK